MGLGSLARTGASKSPEAAAEEGQAGQASSPPGKAGWANRRRSVAQEQAADDRHIRFTIGGVGQRMTKEDFIREVRQLDSRTRKEVVDQSSASQAVKKLAKQDPPVFRTPGISEEGEAARGRQQRPRSSDSISPTRAPAAAAKAKAKVKPSEAVPETKVERNRRLAALEGQHLESEEMETGETPAERKRREAALGMGGGSADDSDDEGDERVPPARRGITFAAETRPGKKGKETR